MNILEQIINIINLLHKVYVYKKNLLKSHNLNLCFIYIYLFKLNLSIFN